jgi:hypothetical protein
MTGIVNSAIRYANRPAGRSEVTVRYAAGILYDAFPRANFPVRGERIRPEVHQ